jgi:hypothetical protein
VRKHLTYANVMATIAVFIALGGGTYAATHVGKNSVGTRQLRNDAVNGTKVQDGSLTGADVNASTLGKVPSSARADTAGTASAADTSKDVASASVAVDGTVRASHGVTGVTVASPGSYCFDLPFKPAGGAVTLDYNDSSFPVAFLTLTPSPITCPPPYDAAFVQTWHGDAEAPDSTVTPEAFFVVFH